MSNPGSKFTVLFESTNTTGAAIASFRLFPNQRWFMSAWKKKRTEQFNLSDDDY